MEVSRYFTMESCIILLEHIITTGNHSEHKEPKQYGIGTIYIMYIKIGFNSISGVWYHNRTQHHVLQSGQQPAVNPVDKAHPALFICDHESIPEGTRNMSHPASSAQYSGDDF